MTASVGRILGAGLAAAAIAVAVPGDARAQETFSVEILNNLKPAAGAEVLFLLDRGKVPLGRTDDDGRLEVPTDLVGEGREVVAYEIECDDEIVVVFVLAEEVERFEEECELRRRENPECECRRIGAFLWGDDVVIDVGRGTITSGDGGAPQPDGDGVIGGLTLGLNFDLRQMYNLEDVAAQADGVTAADATGFAPGFNVQVEVPLFDGMISLGVNAGWSSMETETTTSGGVQMGDLTYYELGGTVRVGPRTTTGLRPYGMFGLFRAWNKGDFELTGLSEHRVHKTRRDGLGAGVDYLGEGPLGLRAEAMLSSTFEDDDADDHVRWSLGLVYRPFAPRFR